MRGEHMSLLPVWKWRKAHLSCCQGYLLRVTVKFRGCSAPMGVPRRKKYTKSKRYYELADLATCSAKMEEPFPKFPDPCLPVFLTLFELVVQWVSFPFAHHSSISRETKKQDILSLKLSLSILAFYPSYPPFYLSLHHSFSLLLTSAAHSTAG